MSRRYYVAPHARGSRGSPSGDATLRRRPAKAMLRVSGALQPEVANYDGLGAPHFIRERPGSMIASGAHSVRTLVPRADVRRSPGRSLDRPPPRMGRASTPEAAHAACWPQSVVPAFDDLWLSTTASQSAPRLDMGSRVRVGGCRAPSHPPGRGQPPALEGFRFRSSSPVAVRPAVGSGGRWSDLGSGRGGRGPIAWGEV